LENMPSEGGSSRDERFPKSERLRKRREYLAVQRRGRKIHLPDLLAIISPRAGSKRVGITVSSKVGGAVTRNRIKRLLREVWRRDRDALPGGLDVVLIAKRRATTTSLSSLRRQLRDLGRRLSPRRRRGQEGSDG
jgi:ribonuclease P protein component